MYKNKNKSKSKSKAHLLFMTSLLVSALVIATSCSAKRPYPTRPIMNTVVWGAGGGTDAINRMIMAEMSKTLGTRIHVTNKTGGVAGSIGMSHVLKKRADGYNFVGISESNVTASVNGGWDKRFDVWSPFIVGGSPDLISVSADSPIDSLEALITKAQSEKIKAAAGGAGSIHHLNLLALSQGTKTTFKFIPYPGSAPSQTAVITGEVDIVISSLAEQAALIKGKKLKPLAMLTKDRVNMANVGEIPSALKIFPTLKHHLPISQAIGFAVRQDTPEAVKSKIASAFAQALQSNQVKQWASDNYYSLSGEYGDAAQATFSSLESKFAWTLHQLGSAKFSPDQFKIPKP